MSKFVDFIMRLGEDIYQAEREQLNRRLGLQENSSDQKTEVEPATSVESFKK